MVEELCEGLDVVIGGSYLSGKEYPKHERSSRAFEKAENIGKCNGKPLQ